MNPYKSLLAFSLAAFILPASAWSQNTKNRSSANDSVINNEKFTIYSTYKPTIAPAPKPEFKASLPIIETEKPNFDYTVPQQNVSYTYKSVPLKPLALVKEELKIPFLNYVKVGYGNLNSLLLDAGIGSVYGENYNTNFHIAHLSQKGKLQNQQSSTTHFDANAQYRWTHHTFDANFKFGYDAFRYYGYDTALYNYNKEDLKQNFTDIGVKMMLSNTHQASHNIWYKPSVELSTYSDNFKASEQTAIIDVPVGYKLNEKFSFGINLRADLTNYRLNTVNNGNNYFQINPNIEYKTDQYKVHVGIKPNFAKNETYILPDIKLGAKFSENFGMNLGWEGDVIKNTYKELSQLNPYINNQYNIQQTRVSQAYLGFTGSISNHLSAYATFSYKDYKHFAMFNNNYFLNNGDGKVFDVVFDEKVTNFQINVGAGYQFGEQFNLKAKMIWNNFGATDYEKILMEPSFIVGANLEWAPIKKFKLGAGFEYWDGMQRMNNIDEINKMKGIFDLNVDANYDIIPRLTVFAQVNNLLNNKTSRWNQYQVYGTNIIGGLRFKF